MSAPVFLVTGGSRGIGEAIAVAAARDGFQALLTPHVHSPRRERWGDRSDFLAGRAVRLAE